MMTVDLTPGSLFFTLGPHSLAIDTESIVMGVSTNDPPVEFSIGLILAEEGLAFSYRLRRDGEGWPSWKEILILPGVSLERLRGTFKEQYTLDLRATAGPDVPSDSYEGVLQLQFRIPSITLTYTLPIVVIVNRGGTIEARLATPEVAGGGGAAAVSEVAIDELYIHHQSLVVSQFHLATVGVPEQPSSPVIYFPFGEGVGRYIYNEIDRQSGKEPVLKGTLSQTEWIEGEPACGNAFALNLGEDGFVEIPADPRMSFTWNQDFTLELWVRTTDATAERTLVQRKRSDDSLLYSLNLFEGVPLFQLATTTDSYAIVKGRESIADGTWHHIACVRESGILKLYVDGNLVDELLPEARIAGAGGADLSSGEPAYLGCVGEVKEIMAGLVDAVYRIGESIDFRMRIADETGAPVTDATPSLLFIHYGYAGQKLSSGLIGRLNYNPDEEEYTYSLDTSTYEEGIYDFFLVSGDGLQEQLRIMLLEVE